MSKEAQATTVIEAQQGMVDRGADISFLSQFSHESETLFPPLMAVEVLSTRVEGHALMVQAKFALNMMSLTLSEVLGKRRKLIDAMGEQIVDQVGFQLEGLKDSWAVWVPPLVGACMQGGVLGLGLFFLYCRRGEAGTAVQALEAPMLADE